MKFLKRWQTPMRITTSCLLKWANSKNNLIIAMRGNLIHSLSKRWMRSAVHHLMLMSKFSLVEKSVAWRFANCSSKLLIFYSLMNQQTTWMPNLFSGSSSTSANIPAPLLRLLTIATSWTMWRNGFLNLIVVARIPTKVITQPTLIPKQLV